MNNTDLIQIDDTTTAQDVRLRAVQRAQARRDGYQVTKRPGRTIVSPLMLTGRKPMKQQLGRPTLERIARLACHSLGVDLADFYGSTRQHQVAVARQIFCYVAASWNKSGRQVQPRYSSGQIGRHLGKDHSTVVHAINHIEKIKARYRERRDARNFKPWTPIKAFGVIDHWSNEAEDE